MANKTKTHPFYHLRPNKFIDRHLFIQTLRELRKIYSIETYQYVGLGSFFFDDFKVIHNQLGIFDMISLESDVDICKRAKFNKPYSCISIQNTTSTDYISSISLEKSVIFWMDYTAPSEIGEQFSDFCTLVGKMQPGDIVRITLNANPTSLDGCRQSDNQDIKAIQENRLRELKNKIGSYVPSDTLAGSMSYEKYPLLLLSCLRNAAYQTLSSLQSKRVLPLFSSQYADGQQMITLTSIIIDDDKTEGEIKDLLRKYDYINFTWDNPCRIQVPELTTKEILHINNSLPIKRSIKQIEKKFSFAFQNSTDLEEAIRCYAAYYKYYPNFRHINL